MKIFIKKTYTDGINWDVRGYGIGESKTKALDDAMTHLHMSNKDIKVILDYKGLGKLPKNYKFEIDETLQT